MKYPRNGLCMVTWKERKSVIMAVLQKVLHMKFLSMNKTYIWIILTHEILPYENEFHMKVLHIDKSNKWDSYIWTSITYENVLDMKKSYI